MSDTDTDTQPDAFYDLDNDILFDQLWEVLVELDVEDIVPVIVYKSLGQKFAGNVVISVDDEGNPDETIPKLFDTRDAAIRAWDESLKQVRLEAGFGY